MSTGAKPNLHLHPRIGEAKAAQHGRLVDRLASERPQALTLIEKAIDQLESLPLDPNPDVTREILEALRLARYRIVALDPNKPSDAEFFFKIVKRLKRLLRLWALT